MNIREEKRMLLEMMGEIIKERRVLTDEIHSIRERVNELSKLEEMGYKDLDLISYFEHIEKEKKEKAEQAYNNLKDLPAPRNHSLEEAKFSTVETEEIKEMEIDIAQIKTNRLNRKQCYNIIKSIMAEAKKPLHKKIIKELLEEKLGHKISKWNFDDVLRQFCKIDENFINMGRSYYDYRA